MRILVKPQKKPRLIFDGSFRPDAEAIPVNAWADVTREFNLHYGTCFARHLRWIWNLRVSYPQTDILLWDDDASGAFRNAKYHPDVCLAFAFRVANMLCVPTGVCFGGNTSSHPWEAKNVERQSVGPISTHLRCGRIPIGLKSMRRFLRHGVETPKSHIHKIFISQNLTVFLRFRLISFSCEVNLYF